MNQNSINKDVGNWRVQVIEIYKFYPMNQKRVKNNYPKKETKQNSGSLNMKIN